MVRIVATSVIRGSSPGDSHGGLYVIDFEKERVYQPIDWKSKDIDWRGHGGDRGLRGVAIDKNRVFVAASDRLLEFNPSFESVACYRNPYLKHCHDIQVYEQHLFVTSTAFDSILAFNLTTNAFEKAFMVKTDSRNFSMGLFNPANEEGPLPMNKLQINSVFCEKGGMYIAGLRTNGLLLYNGKRIGISTTLPAGANNARPFRDGILFNDTQSSTLRYATRSGKDDCAIGVPMFLNSISSKIARPGFGRGLCACSDTLIAAGSSPATVALYDLEQKKILKAINISKDTRNTIHALEVWPYN